MVVAATPIDLASLIEVNKPVVRARYQFAQADQPGLAHYVEEFLKQRQ